MKRAVAVVGMIVLLLSFLGVAHADFTTGGNRLVSLQNNDGGWDWELTDGNPATGSASNTIGPIGMGLAQAYNQTDSAGMLDALTKARTFLLSKIFFSGSDGYLAVELDRIFGGDTCKNYVMTNFYDKLANGTYQGSSGLLYNTADYVNYIRTGRSGSQANMAAWDLGYALYSAHAIGADTTAWIAGTEAEVNELDGSNYYDVLGLAGAVIGLASVNDDFTPTAGEHLGAVGLSGLADKLVSYQISASGGFSWNSEWVIDNDYDEAIQETSYAILALSGLNNGASYMTNIISAKNYLASVQLGTGGWQDYQPYPGYPGSGENNEVTGEALWGLSAVASQATLNVVAPASLAYGNTATLSTTGGSGGGSVTYSTGTSTGCSVAGSTLSVTNVSGTCSVTATKAADSNYNAVTSSAATVTLQKTSQATLNVVAPATLVNGNTATLSTTGGSGGGSVTYSTGTSTGCSVTGSTLSVTNVSGTCSVTATKAADSNYNAATSSAATVTLAIADTSPDPFPFTAQTGVALHTEITSNSITVSGINTAAQILITSGKYSINGGTFRADKGTVNNGDTVQVRLTSANSYSGVTSDTLIIGNVSSTFKVTTIVNTAPTVGRTNMADPAVENAVTISGLTVSFKDASTDDNLGGAGTVYVNWGDGSALSTGSIGATFTKTYASANTYTINHYVKDAGGLYSAYDKFSVTVPTKYKVIVNALGNGSGEDLDAPLAGAHVQVKLNGVTKAQGNTGTSGYYTSLGLDPGSYTMTISKYGKTFDCDAVTAGNQNANLAADLSSGNVTFTCRY